ncbi:uncharacterized protein LOC110406421 [Numida meleagris]|uniref:uncharacterized protein LOC110406421 n=1 Tax=Numida meleagris TaxID=8996 RepID=UPI000B3DA717|nr:uncharacterized protein LOC110406421 [Numida meleagris]
MEILDEFDNECALSVSFCKQVSPEAFEEQSVFYTKQCLQELFSKMEQNPRICERALRKQKQMEKEEAGMVSYIKAKICWTLQGELNYSNYMDIAELEEKVSQLRQRIQKVNNYAQGAKNRKGRYSRPLCGKRYTLKGGFSPSCSKAPEPPKLTMPRVFGPFSEITNKQMDRATTSSPDLKCWWCGLTAVTQKRLPGNAALPSQNAGSTGIKPAASALNTPGPCKLPGGTEDDVESENPGPGCSAKET